MNDYASKADTDSNTISDSAKALIYLLSCAVNGTAPDSSWASRMNHDAVYDLAQAHKVAAMAAFVLEPVYDSIPHDAAEKWRAAKDASVRRCLLFDAEREKHLAWMEAHGIMYMPLKGIIVKDYYPKYGMREMADNDILFDGTRAGELRDHMAADGYDCPHKRALGLGVHDTYHKPPVYNFEFHNVLFGEGINGGVFDEYYADITDRMVPAEGTKYGRRLSANDLYVYVTAHAFKHYDLKGAGIRALTDDYVIRKAKAAELDPAYLDKAFGDLDFRPFAERLRSMSDKLLAPYPTEGNVSDEDEAARRIDSLLPEENKMLRFMLDSGIYGTMGHLVENRLREFQDKTEPVSGSSKLKYMLRRLFPPKKQLEKAVPFAKDRPLLIPAAYVFRVIRGVTVRRRKTKSELNALNNVESSRDHSPF